MQRDMSEKARVIDAVYDYAEQTALRCDTRQINTLHILVECRAKESVAPSTRTRFGLGVPLRNAAMSFVTGVMPRRFQDRLLEAKQTADSTPPTPVVRQQKPGLVCQLMLVVPKTLLKKVLLPGGNKGDGCPTSSKSK